MLISLLFIFPSLVQAAACCGGGASSTGVMTADSRWQLSTSYSDVSLIADSNSESQTAYRDPEQVETVRTTNIAYTHLLSSLWQVGIEIPMVEKIRRLNNEWQSQTGGGDLKLVSAYEFLPEYGRSALPRGFVYTGVSIPTAPSIFTTKRSDLLDSRGTGHYHLLLGTLFQKRLEWVTLGFQPQLSYRLGRKFSDDNFMQEEIETENSLDHLITASAATMLSTKLGMSLSVTRNYMQSKATSTLIGTGQSSLVHDLSVGAIYSLSGSSDVSFNYTDQFLAGESYNHTLGRSVGINLTVRNNL